MDLGGISVEEEEEEEVERNGVEESNMKMNESAEGMLNGCLPSTSNDTLGSVNSTMDSSSQKFLKRRYLFRTTEYMVLNGIRKSGSDGMTLREVAENIIYEPGTVGKSELKAAGRDLKNLLKHDPTMWTKRVEQAGKITQNKMVWRGNEGEKKDVFREFEALTGGVHCLSQGGKLPTSANKNLTLSERNVGRLNLILRMAQSQRVVPFPRATLRKALENAMTDGSSEIDGRSINKYLCVLKDLECIHLHNTVVTEGTLHREVELLTIPTVKFPSAEVDEKLKLVKAGLAAEAEKKAESILDASIVTSPGQEKPLDGTEVRVAEESTDVGEIEANSRDRVAEMDPSIATYDPSATARYGCQQRARLVRMSIAHEYLWYLTRGYAGEGPTFTEKFPLVSKSKTASSYKTPFLYHAVKSRREGEVLEPHVYLDETSWKRFLPPLPKYQELAPGWFLMDDVLLCLPLSIFLLLVPISYDIKGLAEYYMDPIKRHTLVSDLPIPMRRALWYQNRHGTHLTDLTFCLWTMGLLSLGPSKLTNNDLNHRFDYFYVHTGIELLDTSTCGKRYLTIEPPIERYKAYYYHFKSTKDVWTFWLHLRAVALSTKLGHRHSKCDDDAIARVEGEGEDGEQKKIRTLRSRKVAYARMGMKRTLFDEVKESGQPNYFRIGVGGFSPTLFLHRGQNWVLNTAASAKWYVDIVRRRCSESEEKIVSGVQSLNKDWNSVVRGVLVSKDLPWYKSKRGESIGLTSEELDAMRKEKVSRIGRKSKVHIAKSPPKAAKSSHPPESSEGGGEGGTGKARPGKRKHDSKDLQSILLSTTTRSVFTSREKEMLIFLKSLNYFLYHSAKIQVNLGSFRDIMHETCPESRNKTTQALMALLNREVTRKKERVYQIERKVARMERLPRLVAYRESMKRKVPLMNEAENCEYFKGGFEIAHEELIESSANSPSYTWPEEKILEQMKKCTFETFAVDDIVAEESDSEEGTEKEESTALHAALWKQTNPRTLPDLQGAAILNLILSQMCLCLSDGNFGRHVYQIFKHYPEVEVARVFALLRTHGLLTVVRSDTSDGSEKKDFILSVPSRQYFYSKFHHQLTSPTAWTLLKDLREGEWVRLLDKDEDTLASVGAIGVLVSYFVNQQMIFDMRVPARPVMVDGDGSEGDESGMDMDVSNWMYPGPRGDEDPSSSLLSSTPKQGIHFGRTNKSKGGLVLLRQHQFDSVQRADRRSLNIRDNARTQLKPSILKARISDPGKCPEPRGISAMETSITPDRIASFDQFLARQPSRSKAALRKLYDVISSSGFAGISSALLETKYPGNWDLLETLIEEKQVCKAGVSSIRYVTISNARWWFARSFKLSPDTSKEEPILFMPRPWIKPDGSGNTRILRWMSEGVLLTILESPGIAFPSLADNFAPLLQPRVVHDLVDFLASIGCVVKTTRSVNHKVFIHGPFGPPKVTVSETIILEPTHDSALKFATEFQDEERPMFAMDV